ncbi:hypothetical protein ACHQM5_022233 [Ranunculus cassubicifolius]
MVFDLKKVFHGMKPAMTMMLVQIVYAGVNIFYKLSINDGMSMRILVAYRFLFAAAVLCPLAFFLERKTRPKMTWMILFQSFLCGLFGGVLAQNFYVMGLSLTSATFASAMANLMPAITFILAASLGLEKLAIKTFGGKAKVLGTLVGIGGAMVLTFYKGIEINLWPSNLIHMHAHRGSHLSGSHTGSSRALGALLTIASQVCYSIWIIIQSKVSLKYPCPYSSTALMCIMGSIQAVVFALCVEKDWNQWKLGWNIRLLSVAYSGVVASGLMVTLVAWVIHSKGPLFVSIFNPFMLVVVALAGSILLDEKLHLGSILGAVLIVIGLYFVLWGKSKETIAASRVMPSTSSRVMLDVVDIVITSSHDNDNGGSGIPVQSENDIYKSEMKIYNSFGSSLERKEISEDEVKITSTPTAEP